MAIVAPTTVGSGRLQGLIAPWLPVPPTSYGGTQASVDNLARSLTRLGHDVRLSRWASRAVQSLFAVPPQLMGTSVEEAAYLPGRPRAADADPSPR